jgi:hypothetical protein
MGCATSQDSTVQLDTANHEKCISYGTPYTDYRLKVEHQRALLAAKTSRYLPPPKFESSPTAASGPACINPAAES